MNFKVPSAQMQAIIEKANQEIWLQLDTYFNFE